MNTVFNPIFDTLLREVFSTPDSSDGVKKSARYSRPAANIRTYEDKYMVELAVPGLTKADISITIEDNDLIVAANAEATQEDSYKRREFNYGNFKRRFHLPEQADQANIQANMIDGILSISVFKKPEQQPKKITIH